MNNKSTHTARAELANAIRRRYQLATGKQKRRILDEFAASAGYQVVFRDSGAMACSALQPFAFDYVKWPLLIAAWSVIWLHSNKRPCASAWRGSYRGTLECVLVLTSPTDPTSTAYEPLPFFQSSDSTFCRPGCLAAS